MKRLAGVLEAVGTRANVVLAFANTARGRRETEELRAFTADFDRRIGALVESLAAGTWAPSGYRRFVVHDPKERTIHAAPFADRVAHHALMNVAGPWLERGAFFHSYACRKGKGNLAAVRHAAAQTRHHRYFLKLDVRKYFDSVDHGVLADLLRRQFKDGGFLDLMRRLIDSYHETPGRGLPIGTLVSQYLAKFYLDGLDRWVSGHLKCGSYVRYMDDMVLWHDDAERLASWDGEIARRLGESRGLTLKAHSGPRPTREGVAFLGYRITPQGICLSRMARHRFRSRLGACESAYEAGELTSTGLQRRVDALLAFIQVARCRRWRQRLLAGDLRGPDRPGASCAAARGTTTPATAAPPAATGTTPTTAGTTRACVWPQLTRGADTPRLTRSADCPGAAGTGEGSSGTGREAGQPQPNVPGDPLLFQGDLFRP